MSEGHATGFVKLVNINVNVATCHASHLYMHVMTGLCSVANRRILI